MKQLCTNLVVKLDLNCDVTDIDRIVSSAGAFADDPGASPGANNWGLEDFMSWFVAKGHFAVDRDWQHGDDSEDPDEEPNEELPFINGTYVGFLEGGDSMYTRKERYGGTVDPKTHQLINYEWKETNEFQFKVRRDKSNRLIPRVGCDSIGYYRTSGSIDGDTICMIFEYDVDANEQTLEPKLVLYGEWGGPENPMLIKGTWKNANTDDPDAAAKMASIGLPGESEGTFEVRKREQG